MGTATVEWVRQQCAVEDVEAGWERTVQENRKKRLLDGDGEATLTMLVSTGSCTVAFKTVV